MAKEKMKAGERGGAPTENYQRAKRDNAASSIVGDSLSIIHAASVPPQENCQVIFEPPRSPRHQETRRQETRTPRKIPTKAEKPRMVNLVTVHESKERNHDPKEYEPKEIEWVFFAAIRIDSHEFVVFSASDSVNGCLSPPTLLSALAFSFIRRLCKHPAVPSMRGFRGDRFCKKGKRFSPMTCASAKIVGKIEVFVPTERRNFSRLVDSGRLVGTMADIAGSVEETKRLQYNKKSLLDDVV